MCELPAKIELAKTDSVALDALLQEYMPFIRQEAGRQSALGLEYEDRVSLGMLTFIQCVQQYQADRGSFLAFAAVSIRNRLIDESRRMLRVTQGNIPLEREDEENRVVSFQEKAAIHAHKRLLERGILAEEIALLTEQLQEFGIRFVDLDRLSPKHSRLRLQCVQAARALAADDAQAKKLRETKHLPITYLAQTSGLPAKTLEKFRKYMITLIVIFLGDYPNIQAFLPDDKGHEEA